MSGAGLSGLSIDADAERDQRLEEGSEQRALASDWGASRPSVEQDVCVDAEQTSRKRRVGEVVLWRRREACEPAARGKPREDRINDPKPLEHVAIRLCCGSRR